MNKEKEILKKKLEAVNSQMWGNTIIGVIAILILTFVPWVSFENFIFKINLEVIIAFIMIIGCVVRGIYLGSKKGDLEAELSVYSKEEVKEVKANIERETELGRVCAYCNTRFTSAELLDSHLGICKKRKTADEADRKFMIQSVGIFVFSILFIYFFVNNRINLIPLLLISFIVTPWFDKIFDGFRFNWWKKSIVIIVIIVIFILVIA